MFVVCCVASHGCWWILPAKSLVGLKKRCLFIPSFNRRWCQDDQVLVCMCVPYLLRQVKICWSQVFGNKCTTCWWLDNRQRKPCQTHLGHQSAIPSCHIFAPRLDTFERYFQGHGVLTIVSRKERTWLCYYLTSFQIPARHVVGDGACDPGRLWSWSALFISIFIYKYCFVHSNFQIIVLCVVLSPSLH